MFNDYFVHETSAVNRSWICYQNTSKCDFLFLQQFNRDNNYVGFIEGLILITIGILSIPSNMLAIYNFSKKRMNKELLILIYALCCYNFFYVPIIIITGMARFTDNFPMGKFGCVLAVSVAATVSNSTSLTLALISVERRTVLMSRSNDSNMGFRMKKIIFCLILINIFTFTFYPMFFYVFFEMVAIVKYPIYGEERDPVEICMPQLDKSGINIEILFSLSHFIIPLSITSYNYGQIWRQSKLLKQTNPSSRKFYQINIFFARLMFTCLAEFILFQMPLNIVLGIAMLQKYYYNDGKMMTLQSTSAFFALVMIHLDGTLNPLWFSFVTLKKAPNGKALSLQLLQPPPPHSSSQNPSSKTRNSISNTSCKFLNGTSFQSKVSSEPCSC